MQPGLGRQVKDVGRQSEEGVHTTRDSALVRLESGGYIADTPGIRSLIVWDIEPDELDAYFVDIEPYVLDCKFSNCTHIDEPECAVRRAVEQGAIARTRYRHYPRITRRTAGYLYRLQPLRRRSILERDSPPATAGGRW